MIEETGLATCQEDVTVKYNECANTEFPKFVAVHRMGVKSLAEGCYLAESLKPSSGQAVNKMKAAGINDAGALGLCQGAKKTNLDEFTYRKVLRGDEAVECIPLKVLTLTAGLILRQKAFSNRAGRI